MSDEKLAALAHYRDASKSFSYFVTGGSGTLIAYLGEHWIPVHIGFNPGSLELFAIVLLIISVLAGFKMLESDVEFLRNNFSLLNLPFNSQVLSKIQQNRKRHYLHNTQKQFILFFLKNIEFFFLFFQINFGFDKFRFHIVVLLYVVLN